MTDTQDLIARLRTDPAMDDTTLGNEAADALKAAQAEYTKYRNEYATSHAALQFVKAERDAAQAEIAAVKAEATAMLHEALNERDQALARLAEVEATSKLQRAASESYWSAMETQDKGVKP